MDPVVEPESLESCPDLNNPVLHVLVIGFHHKKGCQVEYAYPPLIPGGSSSSCELPSQWKHLPSLALPDGSHNFENDTAYFHLPDLENPRKTSKENPTEIIKFYSAVLPDLAICRHLGYFLNHLATNIVN